MSATLRFISLVLIALALALLGADAITSLEKHGQVTVRSIEEVWGLMSRTGDAGFKAWLGHSVPSPVSAFVIALLAIPAWAITGVPGVVLAFLFGRKSGA